MSEDITDTVWDTEAFDNWEASGEDLKVNRWIGILCPSCNCPTLMRGRDGLEYCENIECLDHFKKFL